MTSLQNGDIVTVTGSLVRFQKNPCGKYSIDLVQVDLENIVVKTTAFKVGDIVVGNNKAVGDNVVGKVQSYTRATYFDTGKIYVATLENGVAHEFNESTFRYATKEEVAAEEERIAKLKKKKEKDEFKRQTTQLPDAELIEKMLVLAKEFESRNEKK